MNLQSRYDLEIAIQNDAAFLKYRGKTDGSVGGNAALQGDAQVIPQTENARGD
jgi:hypothetical protein